MPTNLTRHLGRPADVTLADDLRKTVEQGAATSILLAVSPLVGGVSGRYFADCTEAVPLRRRPAMTPVTAEFMNGVAPYALDPAAAERLWEESLRMIDLVSVDGH
ncbi:hypothetical protein [Nocardia miyunensis]|uniref:hypothetical protein n=1 Tax=Nocardia miyunensis TaxID=282684 RepID=UPI000AF7C96B|nr:hypothetical protein [Nocardia miyunensis]